MSDRKPIRAPHGGGYGADISGLVWSYEFTPQAPPRELEADQAHEWAKISASLPENSAFAWLHFNLSHAGTERWLRDHTDLPAHFFETLREGPGSTRVELIDDSLIAVVNDVNFDFSFDVSDIATLYMCVQHNLVISARSQPLRSVDRLRVAIRGGKQLESSVDLLAHLLRDQADVLQQIGRDAATAVDRIEDSLLTGKVHAKRSTLGSLRRVFVRLRRLLAPEPGALFRLLSRPPTWFEENDAQDLRAATEEFSAVLNDFNALQERTKLLQEEISAHATEQTNRSLFVLTVVTVLALPINIIAGLFGMNVGGIPLSENPLGFWIIVAIIATFTCFAGWYAFFKQRD